MKAMFNVHPEESSKGGWEGKNPAFVMKDSKFRCQLWYSAWSYNTGQLNYCF